VSLRVCRCHETSTCRRGSVSEFEGRLPRTFPKSFSSAHFPFLLKIKCALRPQCRAYFFSFSEKDHRSWQSPSHVASVAGRRGSWPRSRIPPTCHSYRYRSDVPYHKIQELFFQNHNSGRIVRKLEVRSAPNSTSAGRTEVFSPILSFWASAVSYNFIVDLYFKYL
jgi:hypothetical protein